MWNRKQGKLTSQLQTGLSQSSQPSRQFSSHGQSYYKLKCSVLSQNISSHSFKLLTIKTFGNFSQTLTIARGILGITGRDALQRNFLTSIRARNIQIRDPKVNFDIFTIKKSRELTSIP